MSHEHHGISNHQQLDCVQQLVQANNKENTETPHTAVTANFLHSVIFLIFQQCENTILAIEYDVYIWQV